MVTIQLTALLAPVAFGQNLVVNGSFANGNMGFATGYTYSSDLFPESTCFVGSNPYRQNYLGFSMAPHSRGSLMLIVNGGANPYLAVWQETIRVMRRHSYEFSFWAAAWGMDAQRRPQDPSPARLIVTVNGRQVGDVFTVESLDGAWARFRAKWNSGSSGSATIQVLDDNMDAMGNDFAIEDIAFSERR